MGVVKYNKNIEQNVKDTTYLYFLENLLKTFPNAIIIICITIQLVPSLLIDETTAYTYQESFELEAYSNTYETDG